MLTGLAFAVSIMADSKSDSSKQQSIKYPSTSLNNDGSCNDGNLSPAEIKVLIDRLTREENESKEIKQSIIRKLTADMTERGRKIGAHLESIHGYALNECINFEDTQDQALSEELADELRKRTTSVDSEIKQLETQMGQLQRTLVKGKARRESLRHRMSVTSPNAVRKFSAISPTSEGDELTLEEYKARTEILENEKLDWLEDKKDLEDEIKFLKYQLQYRLEVQSLQNDSADKSESGKVVRENEILREENCNLKERLSTINEKLREKGYVEDNLLNIADVSNKFSSGVSSESEIERLNSERKILLSTIMRMQSLDKDEEQSSSFADFGVQVDLNKFDTIEEAVVSTPLVAKLTKENKALKKHITEMQKDLDDYEEERKALSEENFRLIDEKRSLEDTINKLRTQMSDTLDTTLDEIEHLHAFNEDLEAKCESTQAKYMEVVQAMRDLQSNNCQLLERLLDEVETKVTIEDAFDYLDSKVAKLIDHNKSLSFQSDDFPSIKQTRENAQFSSNLLNEVKSCKELLESQRSHIRKLQLDKRDIEEGYTKMKREVLLLKSSKQRARENSKELQFLKKRRAKSLNDGAHEVKTVLVDRESLQREVKRLESMKTRLENSVQKFKKEKATLEDEKVCLLGSLYHQLERNESLETQIEELSAALQQWEAKSDLENEVFSQSTNYTYQEISVEKPNQPSLENNAIKDDATKSVSMDHEYSEMQLSPKELEVEHVGDRPKSPVVTAVGSVAQESMHEMKEKIHALAEQLKAVKESVIDLEAERERILDDLEESKKNEKELRNVIVQLKRENSIHEDKFTKTNELAETLEIRLREAKCAKEEAEESLEEAKAEKDVVKRHCEVLDSRLKEVSSQRDQYKDKTERYNEYLKELYDCITEMVQTDTATADGLDTDESVKSQDELQSGIYNGIGCIQNSVTDVMKQLNEKNEKLNAMNGQLEALNTEKEALQKSLRESDAKKKQLKGFITKLTEEKEKITEQLDETKQQKSNLADALENVYQSKEKLQKRLSDSLCKQEQYKKSLAEAIDEGKTMTESLYRMVNEHETMKDSLLAANREVEFLKSQQRLKSTIDVIREDEEEQGIENDEEEREKLEDCQQQSVYRGEESEERTDESGIAFTQHALADVFSENDDDNFREVANHLARSLKSLRTENSLFETQIEKLIAYCDIYHKQSNGADQKEKDLSSELKDKQSVVPQSSEKLEEPGHTEKEPKENAEDLLLTCVSAKLCKDEETLSFVEVQITALKKHIEEIKQRLEHTPNMREETDAISGLMHFQEELLRKKLDVNSNEANDDKQLVKWFEVISSEKNSLEEELENASRDNIKLLEDLGALRMEKEEMRIKLDSAIKAIETKQENETSKEIDSDNKTVDRETKENEASYENDCDNKSIETKQNKKLIKHDIANETSETKENETFTESEVQSVQKETDLVLYQLQTKFLDCDPNQAEERVDCLKSLEDLDAIQLRYLVEQFQQKNKALHAQISELAENNLNFNAIELELEKSNNETKLLERQVEVLSKEGATLRGEADERVQRLIELEENMILTIEKKLELAEYAAMLTSKKDVLEQKCEELSREVDGLKESRDQILTLKSRSDEEMRKELKQLKEYKEKAIREIEDINDILRIERQDFEAIKIELDSMQRKNRSLKQDLEIASAREKDLATSFEEKLSNVLEASAGDLEENSSNEVELLNRKVLELESDIFYAKEEATQLKLKKDELTFLLAEVMRVYDTEVKEKVDHEQSTNGSRSEINGINVANVTNWIKSAASHMENNDSFVKEFNVKILDVLKEELDQRDEINEKSDSNEVEGFENAHTKLDILIKKIKESKQRQADLQTELSQIKEDKKNLTKELEVKSNFLTTIRQSFEQLLEEKKRLAQKAESNDQQLGTEGRGSSDDVKIINESKTTVCNNCRKLLLECDQLKLTIANLNNDGAELKNKCRQLKEDLLQLKFQEENNESLNIVTNVWFKNEDNDSFNETTQQNISIACKSTPTCESEHSVKDQLSDLEAPIETTVASDQERDPLPVEEETSDVVLQPMSENGVSRDFVEGGERKYFKIPNENYFENEGADKDADVRELLPIKESISETLLEFPSEEIIPQNHEVPIKFEGKEEIHNKKQGSDIDLDMSDEKNFPPDHVEVEINAEQEKIQEAQPPGVKKEEIDQFKKEKDLLTKLKNYQRDVESLKDIKKSLEDEVVYLNEKLKEVRHEQTTEPKGEFQHQEQELDVHSKEKEEREFLITNLKTKFDDLKSISHKKKENPMYKKTNGDVKEESVKLHKMLAERSTSLRDLNEKLGVSKNFMQRILDENKDLKDYVSECDQEGKEMRRELEVLRVENDLKKTALNKLKYDKSQLESKANRLEEALASTKDQLKTRGALLSTLERDKEAFKGNLRKSQKENASLKKQYDLLQQLLESGKQRQRDTEELVKKLKQSCDEMTENFERVSCEKKNIQDLLNEALQEERRKSEEYKDTIRSLDKSQYSSEKTLSEYKEKFQTLTRELRRDKSRRDREIGSIKKENARLLEGEERIQRELENLREQLEYERSKNEKLEEDLKSAIIHNLTLNNSLKVQSEEKDKRSKELEGNKKESKRLNTLTGDLKSRIANLEVLLKATKDEKKFFSDEIEKAKTVNADLRLRLKESNEDKEELEDILVEMRDKRQKLHNEIDKALTERDEFEDQVFDLKKEMTKNQQLSLEEQKKTEGVLEKYVKQATTLFNEVNEVQKEKDKAVTENNSLIEDLEKAKTELLQVLQSASPHDSNESFFTYNQNHSTQLQEAEHEIQRLRSVLEKSKIEIAELKTKAVYQESENSQAKPEDGQEVQIKNEVVTTLQTELKSCKIDDVKESLESKGQVTMYINENMRLRNELKQSESKVASLNEELLNVSKKMLQEEFKREAINRKCTTLEEDLRKSNAQLSRVKANLKASNSSLTDVQRNLRAAEADKERLENTCKRVINDKGVVERVKITSIEVPAASQVTGLEKHIPVAKAQSLESARKEILILEAQVKDMHERTNQGRKCVDRLLSDMYKELTRVSTLLAVKFENIDPDAKVQKLDAQLTKGDHILSYEHLQSKLQRVRKVIDALENSHGKHYNGHLVRLLSKEDSSLFDKLGAVISENHKLKDKLQFLQDKLNSILQEKQVLEEIGSSTRKELRSLVKSLSSEREEMKFINTEHLQMKVQLVEAQKEIEELTNTLKLLEEGAQLTQSSETVQEIKAVKEAVLNSEEANHLQKEHDLQVESKHLEMELMEQDRELQWLRHEYEEVKHNRDELKSRCKKLELEKSEFENANKKLEFKNQDLYSEIKRKERYLVSYREDNERLLTIQKTSEAQIRHLNREIELFSDRVVCCETEKEQIEEINRQQQNEMQELFLQTAKDNVVREKLEKLFYENTKLKEQKKMLSTRLQTLERDMKSQILAVRDLEGEKEELLSKVDNALSEKRTEISKRERLSYLLDKLESESRSKIDNLSRLVEKLKKDNNELCAKNPRLDKIHKENNKLTKDCEYKDNVIAKLRDQNHSLIKENDALHISYDKLKESQKILSSSYDAKDGSLERSASYRISPRISHKSSSKTSSLSSFDRASPASSRGSFSSDKKDSRSRTSMVRRSSSRKKDYRPGGEGGDLTGESSQECFCSPILSVVNLCPYEAQQVEERDSYGVCPACKKRKNRKGTIKEHYV